MWRFYMMPKTWLYTKHRRNIRKLEWMATEGIINKYEARRRIEKYRFEVMKVISEYEYLQQLLEIDHEEGRISSYEKALKEIEYELQFELIDESTYENKILDCKRKFDAITQREYEIEKIKREYVDDYKRECEILKVDFKYGAIDEETFNLKMNKLDYEHDKISELEFYKNNHTIKGKPWVHVDIKFVDNRDPVSHEIVVDYNSKWIERLVKHGYIGRTEDEVIEKWLKEVAATQLHEPGVEPV